MESTIRTLINDKLLDEAGQGLFTTLGNDDSLLEAGLLDSLGMVELMAALEQHFGITFDPLDVTLENMETVQRIAALVADKTR